MAALDHFADERIEVWHRARGPVVQDKDGLVFAFHHVECHLRPPLRISPITRHGVPQHTGEPTIAKATSAMLADEMFTDGTRSAKGAEEQRISPHPFDLSCGAVDLFVDGRIAQEPERLGVAPGVAADPVALSHGAFGQASACWVGKTLPDHEERRLHVVFGQGVQYEIGDAWRWAVVEAERNLAGHARQETSARTIAAPSTMAASFALARSRGRYFMPQSGATASLSGVV